MITDTQIKMEETYMETSQTTVSAPIIKKEHSDKDREKDRERKKKHRSKSRSRERERDKDKSEKKKRRSKSKSREREKKRRTRSRSKERRDKEKERERGDRDRDREREKDKDKEREKEKESRRVKKEKTPEPEKPKIKYKFWDGKLLFCCILKIFLKLIKIFKVPPIGYEHITPMQFKSMQGKIINKRNYIYILSKTNTTLLNILKNSTGSYTYTINKCCFRHTSCWLKRCNAIASFIRR